MRFISQNDDKLVLVQEEPRGPSQLIEINVTANGLSTVSLPDVANLRNQDDQVVIIKKIGLITPSVLTNAPISGNAVAPLTELQKMTLVLFCEGWQKGQNIPILSLNSMFTEGSGEPFRTNPVRFDSWRNLDWNKCFLQFSNGTVSAGQPYTVLIEVEYVKIRKISKSELIMMEGGDFVYQEIVGPN